LPFVSFTFPLGAGFLVSFFADFEVRFDFLSSLELLEDADAELLEGAELAALELAEEEEAEEDAESEEAPFFLLDFLVIAMVELLKGYCENLQTLQF